MELIKVRGGSKEELEANKYNIGIGISLGNKWFTEENILEQVRWSLKYSKDHVVVYVADSIHAINIEVRNRRLVESSRKKALLLGEEKISSVKSYLQQELSEGEFNKIHFCRWDDFLSEDFNNKVSFLKEKYETDSIFQKTIKDIVIEQTSSEFRDFNSNDIYRLGEYIIEEMPEVLDRVKIANIELDAYCYPFDGVLLDLIESIQDGEIFPEIRDEIIKNGNKVCLIVR